VRGTATDPTKLEVGDPHDRFEQEADRVAEQVAGAGPTQRTVPHVQRMTESGLDLVQDDEAAIRTKPAGDQPAGDSGLNAAQADSITRPESGTPLSTRARAVMEQRLGLDFGRVRIHTGAEAAKLNRRLHSRAFTYGRDIWFGAGERPADLYLDRDVDFHPSIRRAAEALGDSGRIGQRVSPEIQPTAVAEMRGLNVQDVSLPATTGSARTWPAVPACIAA
jgi:hypothetical protein